MRPRIAETASRPSESSAPRACPPRIATSRFLARVPTVRQERAAAREPAGRRSPARDPQPVALSRLPAPGSLGPEFERDVSGPARRVAPRPDVGARPRHGGAVPSRRHVPPARHRRACTWALPPVIALLVLELRALSRAGAATRMPARRGHPLRGGGRREPAGASRGNRLRSLLRGEASRTAHSVRAGDRHSRRSLLFAACARPRSTAWGRAHVRGGRGIAAFTRRFAGGFRAAVLSLLRVLAAAVAAQIGTSPVLLWRFNVVSAGAWFTAPVAIPIAAALIALGRLLLALFAPGMPAGALVALFAGGSRLLETIADRAAGVAFLRPTPPLARSGGVSAARAAACSPSAHASRLPASRPPRRCFAFLALRAGPSGPDSRVLARSPRRRAGRRVSPEVGAARRARRRGRTVRPRGARLRAHAVSSQAARPRASPGSTRCSLTHPHPDHALGLFAILDEIPVGALWRSSGEDEERSIADLEAAAASRGVPVRVLSAGQTIRWSGARLRILHSGGNRPKKDATNNQSVVALFERDGRRALMTGDAGAFAEAEILRSGLTVSADVVKIGHHGSRGSTTPEFLAAVAPRAALLSCGKENRFGIRLPRRSRPSRPRESGSFAPTCSRTWASSSCRSRRGSCGG